MHCFRDAPSLQQFLNESPSHELSRLIRTHMDALAAFDDMPLSALAHFFILEQGDSADVLNASLGLSLADTPIETCINHIDWFELVIIVSDAGFGYIVLMPKTINDQSLLNFCASQAHRIQEGAP